MNSYDRGFGPMACAGCGRTTAPGLDERKSFGIYAGVWCDPCWPTSGYRDAADPGAVFSEGDAGEVLDDPDGCAL